MAVSVDVEQHLKRMFLWKCVRRFKTLMEGKLHRRCRQGFTFSLLLLFIPNAANNSACDEFFDVHIVYINTMSGRRKDYRFTGDVLTVSAGWSTKEAISVIYI